MPPRKSSAGGALSKGSANKTAEAVEPVGRRSKRTNKPTEKPDEPEVPEVDGREDDGSCKENDDKSKKAAEGVQGPRELRPKKPVTEEEIEGPKKTKYFEGHKKYYCFPQPTGPSIYFNSSEFNKGGAQAVFSNFHLASFYVGSTYYHSAEHFYQDQKAIMIEKDDGRRASVHHQSSGSRGPVLPQDLNAANLRLFLHSVSAATTHAAATRVFAMNADLEAAWEKEKPLALLKAVRHKFFKCPEERKYLLGTGARELVEASPSDKKCGVGFSPENAEEKRAKWGKNMLGMALMHVRHEIREALAKDELYFDDQDAKVGTHHLEFKKPSVAFQIGMFDIPGMPTCQQQHQQAVADIRKESARRVAEIKRAAVETSGNSVGSIHSEVSGNNSSEPTGPVSGPKIVAVDAVNANASNKQGQDSNKGIIKMIGGALLNTEPDVTETELADVKDIMRRLIRHS
ncbi:hypothetical protein D0865_03148 [Hortaea werneckii]|uniref:NADAR domain-containing protein n=1 Tax=Hortaea werneckii TaxID=91943 RepID=A0A3M7CZ26_HORWE|nr:hypothetical protein D0865_03148 [Hortaea werneckii]